MIALRLIALLLCFNWTATPVPVPLQQLPSAPEPQKTANLNPDLDGIYHISKELPAPKLIYSVEPEFSESARKRKISGNITVKFIVQTDGTVNNPTVVKSIESRTANRKDIDAAASLNPKAMEAVRQYRFEPASFQGKPVPCWMTVEVNYQIF